MRHPLGSVSRAWRLSSAVSIRGLERLPRFPLGACPLAGIGSAVSAVAACAASERRACLPAACPNDSYSLDSDSPFDDSGGLRPRQDMNNCVDGKLAKLPASVARAKTVTVGMSLAQRSCGHVWCKVWGGAPPRQSRR